MANPSSTTEATISSCDMMYEELLFTQSQLREAISSLKQVYSNSIECNPFVEDQVYELLKQLDSLQFKINNLVYNVERTEVTFKKG